MAKPILMPQVGQDLTEGELIEWHVKVGDMVKKGDILAVVESEKASFEVEAYEEGVVLELLCEVGKMAVVLEPLLTLGEPPETFEKTETPSVKQILHKINASTTSVVSSLRWSFLNLVRALLLSLCQVPH